MWTITAQHEGNRAALNISAQHGFLCAFKWGYFSNFAFGLYESIFEYIIRTLIVLLRNFLQQNWLKSRKRISSHGWRQDFISYQRVVNRFYLLKVFESQYHLPRPRSVENVTLTFAKEELMQYLRSVTLGPLHFHRHWDWHCTKWSIHVLCHKNLKLHKSHVRST